MLSLIITRRPPRNVRGPPNGVDIAGFVNTNADELAIPYRPVLTVARFDRLNRLNASARKLTLYFSVNLNSFVTRVSKMQMLGVVKPLRRVPGTRSVLGLPSRFASPAIKAEYANPDCNVMIPEKVQLLARFRAKALPV